MRWCLFNLLAIVATFILTVCLTLLPWMLPCQVAARSYINAIYFPNWHIYQQQYPSGLNYKHTTHVFYAFVWPTEDGQVQSNDEWVDFQTEVDGVKGGIAALNQQKQKYPNIKTILSIGGGGNGSQPFSALTANATARQAFAKNVKTFLDQYSFDGVDIDWEHPANTTEGANFVQLLADLRNALPKKQYLITAALPAGEWVLKYVDFNAAIASLDFINLMAYDFAGSWSDRADDQAQLYPVASQSQSADDSTGRNSSSTAVEYLVAQGVDPGQVLLGIPAYGRSFLNATQPGDAFNGTGGSDGTFQYYELPRPNTTEMVDSQAIAAYCVGGDGGFVSYDNPQTVTVKAAWVRRNGLGGVFFWTGTGDAKGDRSLVSRSYNVLSSAPYVI